MDWQDNFQVQLRIFSWFIGLLLVVQTLFIRIAYFLIALLLVANLVFVYQEMIADQHHSMAWRFYFDRRLNFPFFFSLLLQLVDLFVLYRIVAYRTLSPNLSAFWKTLLVAFFLFALDEAFYIHQHFKMSTFGRIASYDRASWTHYLWVIPYFLVFGTLLIILFKKSAELQVRVKQKLLAAGFVFLSGAVVMEFVGTFYAVLKPQGDLYLLLIKSAEGTLQMIGAVMFLEAFWFALNSYESGRPNQPSA